MLGLGHRGCDQRIRVEGRKLGHEENRLQKYC